MLCIDFTICEYTLPIIEREMSVKDCFVIPNDILINYELKSNQRNSPEINDHWFFQAHHRR